VITNEAINTYEAVEATITGDGLKRHSEIFKALGDRNRLKLLYLLIDGERCVSELLPFFDILQPTVSIHLLTLQDLGLLKARRDGRRRYYSLASDDILIQLDKFCERIDRAIQ
jgi:ArsR family transcriptional regulator